MKELLASFGIGHHEIEIYLDLIENGPSLIATIAQRTSLHRPTIYKVMPALEEKGLVTRTVFGKQHKYVPEHPQRLRLVYAKFKARFEDLLPELERVYDRHEKKPVVRFNHGVKGMRLALEDLISTLQVGGTFDKNTSYIVYGNKVAFYDFRSESIIIIENEVIAESQRNFFMLLYTLLNDERRRKEGALGRSEIMA